MKVLLTGSTGFLGFRLLQRLVEEGHEVRALVRRSSNTADFPPSVEIVYGDMADAESVLAATEGCEAVFHAAALVKSWVPDRSEFVKVNVGGLRNVLAAVASVPSVKKLIYTSSFFAIGPTDGFIGTEENFHPRKFFCTEYERSKALADAIAMEAASNGSPIILLYPGIVYGPGRQTLGNLIVKLVKDHLQGRLPGYVGPATNKASYVHVDDVIDGHLAALERGRVGQRYLLVGSGGGANLQDVFAVVRDVTGRPPPKLHIPFWLARFLGHLQILGGKLLPARLGLLECKSGAGSRLQTENSTRRHVRDNHLAAVHIAKWMTESRCLEKERKREGREKQRENDLDAHVSSSLFYKVPHNIE